MKKKIISKISEGLGNQLFMYANSYSISKKHNLEFLIDPYSGYYQKKHMYKFYLDRFNISSQIAPKKYIFNNCLKNFLKKLLIFLDKFKMNKSFIFEKRDRNKSSSFSFIDLKNTNNHFFIDGNFESEKYFIDYYNDIYNEFSIKNSIKFNNNKYLKLIKNRNVISIGIRQNRYSERINNKYVEKNISKSKFFLEKTIEYIGRALKFFDNRIENPCYLVWSNDFTNLSNYLDTKNFIFVENNEDKVITDFYLLTQCKYFIVGPSTFNWWGAWLSNHKDKICVRPKNMNPSNNIDFWPENWVSI